MIGVFTVIAVFFISCVSIARASPVIENLTISPANPWVGEDVSVSLRCYDSDPSLNITRVYADVEGGNIMFGCLDFAYEGNDTYNLQISSETLFETGSYDVNVHCINEMNEMQNSSTGFTVSKLEGYINSMEQSPFFLGDNVDIYFVIEKDGAEVKPPNSVSFEVKMDNQVISYDTPIIYNNQKGWRLRIKPTSIGQHEIKITAMYGGESVSDSAVIEVKELYQFQLVSIDKTSITHTEPITLKLKLVERDNVVFILEDYLDIEINSIDCEIDYISQSGDSYDVKIIPPTLSSGIYTLKIGISYKNYTNVLEKNISYTIPIGGEFVQNTKGLNVQLKFNAENGLETSINTDKNGKYSGFITPGLYKIELLDKDSGTELTLYDVNINDYDDSIKYYHFPHTGIEGISVTDIFVFETDLSYSNAYIEMRYDENYISNMETLGVYECDSWNPGKQMCDSEWEEIDSDIDLMRKVAKINVNEIMAFAVGNKKAISMEFNLDKAAYALGETIKITGVVKDTDGNSIKNASVTANIKETGSRYTTSTKADGSFYMELPAPQSEGLYTLKLEAGKNPYSAFTKEENFRTEMSRRLDIEAPDSIRIEKGKVETYNFSIVNKGQSDLYDIELSITGFSDIYLSKSKLDFLKAGKNENIAVDFVINKNATESTYPVVFEVVSSDGIQARRTIALTIISEETKSNITEVHEEGNKNEFILPTGFILQMFEGIETDVYIIILCILAVPAVYALKKKKLKKKPAERAWIKNTLSAVNNEISRSQAAAEKKTRKRRKRKKR